MRPHQITQPAEMAFAKELKAARLHAGIGRTELARRACMTRQGIVKIEKGEGVTLGTIALLANGLGCQIADLFPRKSPWQMP